MGRAGARSTLGSTMSLNTPTLHPTPGLGHLLLNLLGAAPGTPTSPNVTFPLGPDKGQLQTAAAPSPNFSST